MFRECFDSETKHSRHFEDSGFNYESAPTIGHNEMWLQYTQAETERDMDYAKRLNLNQVRVFLGYTAYLTNKAAFRTNLVNFIRVCHERASASWSWSPTRGSGPRTRLSGRRPASMQQIW